MCPIPWADPNPRLIQIITSVVTLISQTSSLPSGDVTDRQLIWLAEPVPWSTKERRFIASAWRAEINVSLDDTWPVILKTSPSRQTFGIPTSVGVWGGHRRVCRWSRKTGENRDSKTYRTRNVGQCPTSLPPCRIYRWRPLFNAAKFGWRPLLECCAITLPRRETRWN